MDDELTNAAAEGPPPLSGGPPGVRPPTVISSTELPFRDLDWERFECLCRDIAKAEGLRNVYRYGRRGQKQHGIDFRGETIDGHRRAFQVKRVEEMTDADLREAVGTFASGTLAPRTDTFIICMSVEANEAKFQDELVTLQDSSAFGLEVWDAPELTHRLRNHRALAHTYFGEAWVARFFADDEPSRRRLDARALLLGPVEARGLAPKVEEAQRLAETSPASAAKLYEEIADALSEHFSGHADRFQQLRARALKDAGDPAASHDVLMDLAIRDLFVRAEPQLASGVAHELRELQDAVDEVRQARGSAVSSFVQWHEYPDALVELAEHFDNLGPDDHYAPFVATLVAEAALAERAFQIVLDREENLRRAGAHGDRQIALRVRAALADAGVLGAWPDLISEAESFRFPADEGTYICLRGARWCAWNGHRDRAESLYRQAMKLGAEVNLDLDVENALWSLTALYTLSDPARELLETNQLALSITGTRSYVTANSRTRQRSYQYMVNGRLPDALLWSRYRLLESIRSGCLMDEWESHAILARLHNQAGDPFQALEHAVYGGGGSLVKEIAPQVGGWPRFLADTVDSPSPWVRPVAHSAVALVGDFAPPEVARSLVRQLLQQLSDQAGDVQVAAALFEALGAVVLGATDDDLERLMPSLELAAPREPDGYLLTDPGVGLLAARLYRFRPAFRQRAASVLGEMAIGAHTNDWDRALGECGDDVSELIAAFKQVAEREQIDLAGALSDLGHLTAATRAVWSQRLQFVAAHPLGKSLERSIGPRYDVPPDFLREQDKPVIHRYVEKLVAIGSNSDELAINREIALGSATNGVDFLDVATRRLLFERVRPLTEPGIDVSEADRFNASSLHPLSRFRFSLGSATDIRASALRLLGRIAGGPSERSVVVRTALGWIRSDDQALQRAGASLLTLPSLSISDVPSAELASHENPWVRRAAIALPSMREHPEVPTLEALAADPFQPVRVRVVYALPEIRDFAPEAYEHIAERLRADESAIVRAIATEVLASVD